MTVAITISPGYCVAHQKKKRRRKKGAGEEVIVASAFSLHRLDCFGGMRYVKGDSLTAFTFRTWQDVGTAISRDGVSFVGCLIRLCSWIG